MLASEPLTDAERRARVSASAMVAAVAGVGAPVLVDDYGARFSSGWILGYRVHEDQLFAAWVPPSGGIACVPTVGTA